MQNHQLVKRNLRQSFCNLTPSSTIEKHQSCMLPISAQIIPTAVGTSLTLTKFWRNQPAVRLVSQRNSKGELTWFDPRPGTRTGRRERSASLRRKWTCPAGKGWHRSRPTPFPNSQRGLSYGECPPPRASSASRGKNGVSGGGVEGGGGWERKGACRRRSGSAATPWGWGLCGCSPRRSEVPSPPPPRPSLLWGSPSGGGEMESMPLPRRREPRVEKKWRERNEGHWWLESKSEEMDARETRRDRNFWRDFMTEREEDWRHGLRVS